MQPLEQLSTCIRERYVEKVGRVVSCKEALQREFSSPVRQNAHGPESPGSLVESSSDKHTEEIVPEFVCVPVPVDDECRRRLSGQDGLYVLLNLWTVRPVVDAIERELDYRTHVGCRNRRPRRREFAHLSFCPTNSRRHP